MAEAKANAEAEVYVCMYIRIYVPLLTKPLLTKPLPLRTKPLPRWQANATGVQVSLF